ncbi:MAG: LuxR C-terminal-related transcriptional regulator [Muribaculaceae bacterium]|nr:LuxR C-terminal-related transcriptional regulator [Muribaculaceae bacterium]
MDVLRKELTQIYTSQHLEQETLSEAELEADKGTIQSLVEVSKDCAVITDASNDSSFLFPGFTGSILGIPTSESGYFRLNSSDEDIIYERLHPEDLVEKRMLEFELFSKIDKLSIQEKLHYKATCTIRIKDKDGQYKWFDNITQILRLSPAGKMWLILCRYEISSLQHPLSGIRACIINTFTGKTQELFFTENRKHILTDREKEILLLIKAGNLSKQIADKLGISLNTVNRHRQNILEKLSVNTSAEAVSAAIAMRLI